MAGTLQIKSDDVTVDLLDSTGLYIDLNGWEPAVAIEDENGDYEDIVDVITCNWNETNDDDRAETLKSIKKLDRQAQRYWRRRQLDKAVWLRVKTHSETDHRNAIIKRIDIQNLHHRHWSGDGPSKLTLAITHTLWRRIEPGGTPTTVVNNVGIYNIDDADGGDDHVTITSAQAKGDAPALAEIRYGFFASDLVVGTKRGSIADLDDFENQFIPANELDLTWTGTDNDELGGSSDATARWTIVSDLDHYDGTYLVYAIAAANSADKVQIRFQHGFNGDTKEVGEYVEVNDDEDGSQMHPRYYLGRFTIPRKRFIPGRTPPTDYEVELHIDKSASVTFKLKAVVLIPADDQIFAVSSTQEHTDNIYMDGIYEETYIESVLNIMTGDQVSPEGRYIKIEPGENTRLYFLTAFGESEPKRAYRLQSFVTIRIIPQYTSLRGDD